MRKIWKPIIDDSTLTIVVSQSGETIDTLAALKEAKRLGSKTMAVTNVVGSSIAREADQVIYTCAGPEIAVASTKAYTTQLIVMFLLNTCCWKEKLEFPPSLAASYGQMTKF